MPDTEKFYIDAALVHRLISSQFPQWAHLTIKPVEFEGWDNRTFHLGEYMTVRLPSNEEYAPSVEKEQLWLPKLAPLLPLPIPTPVALGVPTEEYPWHWSIYKWLEGDTAANGHINDLSEFAIDLTQFLIAFQKINASSGPHNFYRGSSLLSVYDTETRQAINLLHGKIDTAAALTLWNIALSSKWQSSPVWFHGDIAVGNMLVQNGQLSAVIDFGSIGVGDPACDLAITWTLFKDESRDVFRANLPLDNATWERARGWALWKALITCAELAGANPREIEKSWLVIDEVLSDYKRNKFVFRPLSLLDVPLMHQWFNLPHVQKFYSLRAWTETEVLDKLKPYIHGDKPVFGFMVFINEKPIGYVQKYKISDYPWPNQNLAKEIINNAAGMDLFIGDETLIGKGIGSQVVQAFLESKIWPEFQYCIVDPDMKNIAAIRCYEKLNFRNHAVIETKDALGKPAILRLMILQR